MAVTVRTLENFVGGEWVAVDRRRVRRDRLPGHRRDARRSAGRELGGRRPRGRGGAGGAAEVGRALAWERAAVCHAIADLIDERREEFARELSLEQGKPYAAEALPDIDETAENFRIAAEDVKRMETGDHPVAGPEQADPHLPQAERRLRGITPWNFPTLIPVELIAPGIAAGNTIVMKPSEWTPIAMANFMQIMADAGLPDGVVNVSTAAARSARRSSRIPGRLHRLRRLARDGGEDRPRRRAQALA